MKIASFYTKRNIDGFISIGVEQVAMCNECVKIESPDSYYHTDRPNICVRCGIRNFRKEDAG